MFSRALTSTVALAGAASALMIPPSIPEAVTQAKANAAAMANQALAASDEPGPGPTRFGQPKASIELACPHCPLAVGSIHGHPMRWAEGADTRLLIDLTSDGSQLFFNGAPIYPPSPKTLGRRLSAQQVYANEDNPNATEQLFGHRLPLSSGIEVHEQVKVTEFHLDASRIEDVVQRVPLRSMDIEIMGLGQKMIKVDTIRVQFAENTLKIHGVDIIPYGSDNSAAEKQCETVLCRIQTDLKAKIAAFRQKMGSTPVGEGPKVPCSSPSKPAMAADSDAPSAPAGMPMPAKGGHPFPGFKHHAGDNHFPGFRAHAAAHHHHSGAHGVLHATVHFFYHIIFPVMVGIAAGMLVSGIGMLLGQLIVFVCSKIFGRRGDGYESLQVIFVDDPAAEEEYLPRYEDVYEEEPGTPPPPFNEEKEILQ